MRPASDLCLALARSSRAQWWPRSALATCSRKAATSAPGFDWCRSRYRPATARSSAVYQGAAISTCARCSCKPLGAGQGQVLGALWPRLLDQSRQEAIAPQRARDCARQQARPDRLGGPRQGTRLRVRQDGGDGVPTCLILAPCAAPSRRSLAAAEQGVRTARRPPGTNKGTARSEELSMT
jgi:hypothetical protein